jgi:hypothetical protein
MKKAPMKTTLTIDEKLFAKAVALATPKIEKSELIRECMKVFIQQQTTRRLADLGGSAPDFELAALFQHADAIPGMCDHEKFCGLCEIARHSPAGDIVEIGSWWGKSAFILARLARCYAIGKLLCVDPSSNAHLAQNDETGMVNRVSAQVDAEETLAVFEMNLLPYNANHVNYLRMPSTEGAQHYRACRDITTASFGTTRYDGHIAILHIDGNHSYAAAKADIEA